MPSQPLASLPIALVFAIVVAVSLLAYEAGFRFGREREAGAPADSEGASGLVAGSLLALFAFLLAFTMGMAADRFQARRDLVLQEANSIETTYLRAGFLPEPERTQVRNLLREYVPLRIAVEGIDQLRANDEHSGEVQDRIWTLTEAVAARAPESEVLGTYIVSLNEMIDVENARLVVGVYGRLPDSVIGVLLIGGALSIFVLGYHAGIGRRRSPTSTVLFILVLSVVVTLIVDLDWPRGGFISVSQDALINLQAELGPPQ
jgi:hypothetical protein